MRSNALRPPDEAHGSLSDSTYEVLSKSMCETSDDEAHTESLASNDGHTPDDLSSLCDDDEFGDDHDDAQDEDNDVGQFQHELAPSSGHSSFEPLASHYTTSPDDSMMTSRPDIQQGEPPHLILEETVSSSDNNRVDMCGVIREFNDTSGLPDVLQEYGFPELRLSVKMAGTRHFLPISRSFRLLYVGGFDSWVVTDVNSHIAAALHATPTSRFNIVHGSDLPGSASSSRVQLERSGSELVVDHCAAPEVICPAAGATRVIVTLNDGSQITFGPKGYLLPNTASLPDLVIFGHRTVHTEFGPAEAEETFRVTRDMIRQHDIPTLDIAVVRPYTDEAFDFHESSLRLCVEGRPDREHNFKTQKTLPIDLYSFLGIDPSQLNRHLAYLNDRSNTVKSASQEKVSGSFYGNILGAYTEPGGVQRRGWASIVGVILLVMIYVAHSALMPVLLGNHANVDVQSESVRATSTLLTSSSVSEALTTATSTMTSVPTAPVVSTPKDLTVPWSEKVGWMDLRPAPSKEHPTGSFEIEVTGDHEFVIHPSKQLIGKRKLQLQVQVHRDAEAVPVRILWPAQDACKVLLEREYPIGMFNVSIVAGRKPLHQRWFEVQLGSKQSTFSSVMKRVEHLSKGIRHDLAVAQAAVKSMSTQVSEGLHEGATRIESSASVVLGHTRYWKQQLQDSTQTIAEHLQEAKKVAKRQLKVRAQSTNNIKKALRHNWKLYASQASQVGQGIKSYARERTRPWRTSPRMLLARERALRIRCKIESGLGKKGAKSCMGTKQHYLNQ